MYTKQVLAVVVLVTLDSGTIMQASISQQTSYHGSPNFVFVYPMGAVNRDNLGAVISVPLFPSQAINGLGAMIKG